MPERPEKACSFFRCKEYAKKGSSYCEKHEKKLDAQVAIGRASASKRGYDHRWHKVSTFFLSLHPLCVMCEKKGIVTAATCVDHIIPHRGDYNLFWDSENFQALCASCHSKKTASEDGGFDNPLRKDTIIQQPKGSEWF